MWTTAAVPLCAVDIRGLLQPRPLHLVPCTNDVLGGDSWYGMHAQNLGLALTALLGIEHDLITAVGEDKLEELTVVLCRHLRKGVEGRYWLPVECVEHTPQPLIVAVVERRGEDLCKHQDLLCGLLLSEVEGELIVDELEQSHRMLLVLLVLEHRACEPHEDEAADDKVLWLAIKAVRARQHVWEGPQHTRALDGFALAQYREGGRGLRRLACHQEVSGDQL
mmetsp:Transcript_70793/g.140310  ORF Transcript_70793/g.140310 Transcript_70793/m.140310 type:complete len:222 (+) Transcript_70793:426-1091(+)